MTHNIEVEIKEIYEGNEFVKYYILPGHDCLATCGTNQFPEFPVIGKVYIMTLDGALIKSVCIK